MVFKIRPYFFRYIHCIAVVFIDTHILYFNGSTKLIISLNKLYAMKEEPLYEIESEGSNVVVYLRNSYNHFHNILRLFDILTNFPFITSETMRDCYL